MTFVTAILALALPAMASAATFEVDGDDATPDPADTAGVDCGTGTSNQCDTIQRGVLEAEQFDLDGAGDTVHVNPADEQNETYPESVTITESELNVLGPFATTSGASRPSTPSVETEAIVDPAADTPAFIINGNNVEVDGFAIVGATGNDIAGVLINGTGASVANNIIRDNTIGVRPTSTGASIDSNAFYSNNALGTNTGNGISTTTAAPGVDDTTVTNNTFDDHDTTAVRVMAPAGVNYDGVSIGGNTSSGDSVFLNANGLTNSTVSGNSVSGAGDTALVVGGSLDLGIERNVLDNSTNSAIQFVGTGAFEQNDDVTVQGNDVTDSGGAGILISDEAFVDGEVVPVHVNRILGNDDTAGGIRNEENGTEIDIDATNNWWGCNEGPDLPSNDCDDVDGADIDVSPFLVFDVTANPTTVIFPGGSSTITASYRKNNLGTTVPQVETLFPSVEVLFTESGVGTLSDEEVDTNGGEATVDLTASTEGDSTVTGTSDNDLTPSGGDIRETDTAPTVTFFESNPTASDTDGDGVPNTTDNCDNTVNPDQLNTDGDGFGNACDADDDGDGDADTSDNCPLNSNSNQLDTDGDGQGDVCDADDDGDGDADTSDNCPLNSNSNQLDTDGDGVGDVCDTGAGPGTTPTTPTTPTVPGATVVPCAAGTSAGVVCQSLNGVIIINGTSGDDVIVGTPGRDIINGLGGNDRIIGGGGNDTINGDGSAATTSRVGAAQTGTPGNDVISGGSGRDRISGNAGNDRMNGNSGNDRMNGNSGNDRVSGSSGRDSVSGSTGRDRLSGGSSSDRLNGNSGNDRVSGNSGNDRLRGGSGRDRLNGGSGRDRLIGGSGRDRLIGGPGRDRTRQ